MSQPGFEPQKFKKEMKKNFGFQWDSNPHLFKKTQLMSDALSTQPLRPYTIIEVILHT